MVVFLYTNGHYEHLFNLQAADFDRTLCCVRHKLISVTHNAWSEMYMTNIHNMLWRPLLCLFKGQVPQTPDDNLKYFLCYCLPRYVSDVMSVIVFGFFCLLSLPSVKESLRGTVKRQTEHSNTLKRWTRILTWLKLMWKRYVSSHSCTAPTSHASLSPYPTYSVHSCTLLPSLAWPSSPSHLAPSPFSGHFLFFSPYPPTLTPHSALPKWRQSARVCLMPGLCA